MLRKLVVSDGTRERELQLVGRLVVGRDPVCDISQDHSLLSRRHAEFVTVDGGVTVRDLGSRNGIFVNGVRAAEQVLEPGDVVQVGPLRARYVVETAPAAAVVKVDADSTAIQSTSALAGGAAAAYGPAGAGASAASGSPHLPPPALEDRGDDDQDETKLVSRLVSGKDAAAPLPRPSDTDDEADRTWLVSGPEAARIAGRGVAPVAQEIPLNPPSAPSGEGPVDVSADTVLLLTPRAEKGVPPPPMAPPASASVVPPVPSKPSSEAPAAGPSTSAPAPEAAAPRAAPADAAVDERTLRNMVVIHVLVAVAIVAAAGAVPFMMLRAATSPTADAPSLLWLALPVAAGVSTAVVISGRIAREIASLVNGGGQVRI